MLKKSKKVDPTILDVNRSVNALYTFHDDLFQYNVDNGPHPLPASQAFLEMQTPLLSVSIRDAVSLGTQSITIGADHMAAFTKLVTVPASSFAPWTCMRAMMESVALASWLLDPAIDARVRSRRVFARRYDGFMKQLKFANATKNTKILKDVNERIEKVEQKALAVGHVAVIDKNGKRIGIGEEMPSIVELIRITLNAEGLYRLYSAIAHSQHWATQQAGFRVVDTGLKPANASAEFAVGGKYVEQYLDPNAVVDLCVSAMLTMAKPIWYQCKFSGWDANRLAGIFDKASQQLEIKMRSRFWYFQK